MSPRPRLRLVLAGLLAAATVVTTAVVTTSSPVGAQSIFGPDTCLYGFVWREATANDRVCVSPVRRDIVAHENALHAERRSPNGGPFGPETCLEGFVWRDSIPGDTICVTPESRTKVFNENNTAQDRRALDWYSRSSPVMRSNEQTYEWQYSLELTYTGLYTFKGSLINYRTFPVDFSVVCSIPTLDGRLISISRKATAGKDSRSSWNLNGTSAEIANHWHAIPRNQPIRCQSATNTSVSTVVNRIQQAEKVVSGVVKVIAWF